MKTKYVFGSGQGNIGSYLSNVRAVQICFSNVKPRIAGSSVLVYCFRILYDYLCSQTRVIAESPLPVCGLVFCTDGLYFG